MAKDDIDVWFGPKTFGYGAGLPVAWQGWTSLGGYVAVIGGLPLALMPRHPVTYCVVVAIATVALIAVAARHTRGGRHRRG